MAWRALRMRQPLLVLVCMAVAYQLVLMVTLNYIAM